MSSAKDRYTHWQSIMDRYETGEISQEKFCEQNQIDFKKFQYYRWQLSRIAKRKASLKFSEVKLAPVTFKQAVDSNKLYLKHQSGIECYIPNNVSEAQLVKLIQGLLAC